MPIWKSICLIVMGLAPGLAADEQAVQPHLTLLTEENLPYNYTDPETGDLVGSSVEIAHELMSRAGVTYTLTKMPWRRAYGRALENANTCVFAMNKTPERTPLFQWVSPFAMGGWSVFKRPESDITLQSIQDVKQYSLVGKRDSVAVRTLEQETGVKVVTTTGDELAAKMLFHGRAHLWISGVVDGPKASVAAGLPEPAVAYKWMHAELGMGCSLETDPALIERLQTLLDEMSEFVSAAISHH